MKRLLWLPIVLMNCNAGQAETIESIDALLASVRSEYGQACKTLEFAPGFAAAKRIDGDRLDDLLVDYHALLCDGSTAMFCGSGGCDMILYIQQEDRSYRYLTAIFGHAIDFDRPDTRPPSFVAALHGNECGRSGMEPCSIRYKIDGDDVVEVGEVKQVD